MYYYKTTSAISGTVLADILADIRREGMTCDCEAVAFSQSVGAESYVPAVGSEWGGVSALVFPRATVHQQLFDIDHQFVPITDENGNIIKAENGTPYFQLNYTLSEEAMRYDRAQRMQNRADKIISPGKLSISAVANMMSRTQIIREATGRKPKYTNEFQILNGQNKFIYQKARASALAVSREHEQQWLETYSKLVTKSDWRNMFPHGLTSGDYEQLVKSRKELSDALDALKDVDWGIVVTIKPGNNVTSTEARNNVLRLARQLYALPVVTFGTTHRALCAAFPDSNPSRPSTFRIGQTEYVQIREEAKAEGLAPITAEEYKKALDSIAEE